MTSEGAGYVVVFFGALAAAVALGVLIGYAIALRYRGQIAAQAIAAALPVLAQRIQIELLPPAVVRVPARVELTAYVPPMEPITIPVEVLPAPANVELARRIVAELPDVGPRQLARILDVAPSSAHALLQTLKQDGTPHEPANPDAL